MEKQIVILGAGAAGLGANYSLKQKGYNPIVLEKDETYGGLCGNFMIAGFRFDRFVHFDFTQIDDVFNIFKKSTDMYIHQSNPFNIYNGIWIKHPAQNNLYPYNEYALAYMHLETCNCSASRKMEKILNLHSNSNIYKFYKDDKR